MYYFEEYFNSKEYFNLLFTKQKQLSQSWNV